MEVVKKQGDKDKNLYFLVVYEPDTMFFKELDKDTLKELYRLIGKWVPERDTGKNTDTKDRKKKSTIEA